MKKSLRGLCVLCGKPVVDMSKEHTVPKWLIRLAGDISRDANFAIHDGKISTYPWIKYEHDCCRLCNDKSNELIEKPSQLVIKQLLFGSSINSQLLAPIFRFADKLRLASWRAHLLSTGNEYGIAPRFAVFDMIEACPAFLWVFRCNMAPNGLILPHLGMNFTLNPRMFAMRLNGLFIVSLVFDDGPMSERLVEGAQHNIPTVLRERSLLESMFAPLLMHQLVQFSQFPSFARTVFKRPALSHGEWGECTYYISDGPNRSSVLTAPRIIRIQGDLSWPAANALFWRLQGLAMSVCADALPTDNAELHHRLRREALALLILINMVTDWHCNLPSASILPDSLAGELDEVLRASPHARLVELAHAASEMVRRKGYRFDLTASD
jgi:hypothetical protein